MNGFSIVLCTYNGVSRLAETLSHLANLQRPAGYALELVFVDNASTDSTAIFTEQTWQTLGSPYTLRLLHESRTGKGYAVEVGYDSAKYSCILTVDDDNWLQPDYLNVAVAVLAQDPTIGILQGHSTGRFEVEAPVWLAQQKKYFIIGSPIEQEGYFPAESFFVWGAGMVIKKADWDYIRSLGFSFLTSKMAGKAAGEDNETAIALLMLGRKIYYSDKLRYQHYMPKERMTWVKLRQNFEVFGYTSYYFFLYALVADAYEEGYEITDSIIRRKFFLAMIRKNGFTWQQHVCYWVKPMEEWYQLELTRRYSQYKWFVKLVGKAKQDIRFIQSWMVPLFDKYGNNIVWQKQILDRE